MTLTFGEAREGYIYIQDMVHNMVCYMINCIYARLVRDKEKVNLAPYMRNTSVS